MQRINLISSHHAKQMTSNQKKNVALKVINKKGSVTEAANQHGVSRQFVYRQKDKAMAAVDQAFDDVFVDNSKVLFYLPVTKAWIAQLVLCLLFYGRTSFRSIKNLLKDCFDYDISISGIHNISGSAQQSARRLNAHQDLSPVKLAAHDELFHHNKPVVAGVDIPSLYCYLLSHEDHRDSDTWAIHFMDLQQQGFKPERVIGDDGDGLRCAHKNMFPDVPFDYDLFHLLKLLMDTRRYFRNRYNSSVSHLIKVEHKMEKAKLKGNPSSLSRSLGEARKVEETMRYLTQSIDTLVSWMTHDVLNKAGPTNAIRQELYDFIVDEFEKLEDIHPHRIESLRFTLKDKKNLVLSFCDVLDDKFKAIAKERHCSLEVIWQMCELLRCDLDSDNYAVRSLPLQQLLGDQFDEIEDAVIVALSSTEQTSSMVENLNSRLRPYFFLRREIGNDYLGLLRFFLNHKPFERSNNPNRQDKSPAELLSGKPHPHWLEMLGHTRFSRTA